MADQLAGVIAMLTVLICVIVALFVKYVAPVKSTGNEIKESSSGVFTYKLSSKVLFGTRVASFLWFFIVVWIYRWAAFNPNYWYFTVWNIILLAIYFLLASICSLHYLLDPDNKAEYKYWLSPAYRQLCAEWLKTMSDVAGCNAVFVTVVTFGVLDRSMEFWNIAYHLSNSLLMFVDTFQNRIKVEIRSCLSGIIFLYGYCIFAWLLVKAAGIRPWPYFFLKTDSAAAYGWYIGLLVLYFLFFYLWFSLSKQRLKMLAKGSCCGISSDIIDDDTILVANETDTDTTEIDAGDGVSLVALTKQKQQQDNLIQEKGDTKVNSNVVSPV